MINRLERLASLNDLLNVSFRGNQSKIWTALPGIVQSFNAAKKTVVVQPAIQARVTNRDGSFSWIDLPPLLDCPVVFQGGGGYTMTFPIAQNDEALVIFSSRCIDTWWQSGGYKNLQACLRMHDLSDGFAIVGISSVPHVPASISTSAVQVRDSAGTTNISLQSGSVTINAASVTVNSTTSVVNASGGATINGATNIVGNLSVTGAISATTTISATGNISSGGNLSDSIGSMATIRSTYNSHTHTDPQGGNTGTPTPTM